jgi:glutamine synthetase
MAQNRQEAVRIAQQRDSSKFRVEDRALSTYFKENIFDDSVIERYLTPDKYRRFLVSKENRTPVDEILADDIAKGMKSWAQAKGATHYTHWFQPLTGSSAEKHDAFEGVAYDGSFTANFKGCTLFQQEPDASSLPSGGIRQTFEARGYTSWDITSPPFIRYNSAGSGTLCIPSLYNSFTGESLDTKTPLLRSINLLNKAATNVGIIFDRHIESVKPYLGLEQEYFLIDEALYNSRPDLVMADKTVFGHIPAKGQQLEDHYFGSIPSRIHNFMIDFETEAQKLGIPVRTRHNEVAPAQFEVAPIHEEANIACDHNILMMDLMRKTAQKHKLAVLFHEKPFSHINGSGKHANWSLFTNAGVNLLAPSTKPKEGLRFVTFLVNVIKAVHENADLLRASVADWGNEYRLGGLEAPPTIMSVFLGSEMTAVLEGIEKQEIVKIEKGENAYLKLGLTHIPAVLLGNTDRNRTSPFAFTGDKFEYRAVGSSANAATPMMVLNTIVANQLEQFKKDYDNERLVDDSKKEGIVVKILKKYIGGFKDILFEGNSYSEEWKEEAKRRGLSNITSTPEALKTYLDPKFIDLFEQQKILNKTEIVARYNIELLNYVKKVQIESRVIGDLAQNHIISTAIGYQSSLIQNAKNLKEIGLEKEAEPIVSIIKNISEHVSSITFFVLEMTEKRKKANVDPSLDEQARIYSEEVKPYFEKIRYHVDKLELIIDDKDWPLAKYREMFYLL